MWSLRQERVLGGRGIRFCIETKENTQLLTCIDVFLLWQLDSMFRSFFSSLMINCPFKAFRWETPAVSITTRSNPFEFVLIDSPALCVVANQTNFNEHFMLASPGDVITFPNLGNDAVLVVPCPDETCTDYAHISSFLKSSTEFQKHLFWQRIGFEMERRIAKKPVWLNTEGSGVAWVHVRLDNSPKYYCYSPFRNGSHDIADENCN